MTLFLLKTVTLATFIILSVPAKAFTAPMGNAEVPRIEVPSCTLSSPQGRSAQLARLQTQLGTSLANEIQSLLQYHQQTLAMDRRIATTPELDEVIDHRGERGRWKGIHTSEAQVWAYMNRYETAIDTPWLPYRWFLHGSGFKGPAELYGTIPGESVPTVKKFLEAYPAATRYIVDRQAALERDETMKRELRALLVSAVVSTAFSLPMTGTLTFGAVARIAWKALEGNVQEYFGGLARVKAQDWVETILSRGLAEDSRGKELVRKQVESALELVDPQEAQKVVAMIYSLHYATRDKLQSLSAAVDMAEQRGGAQEADTASWLTSMLEAVKSAQTQVQYLRDQREILERKCLDHARQALAKAPPVRSLREIRGSDIAFASLIKERSECVVNQHTLLMIEMKWLADLGQMSQQLCQDWQRAGI